MQALIRLNARIYGLIVCIFVLSGYDAVHAMELEARVKELHGSLVTLKKKLTSLKSGLESIKSSLSGKAHSSKRKASGPVVHSVAKKLRGNKSPSTGLKKKPRPSPATPSSGGKLATPGSKKKPIVLPFADMIEKLKNDPYRMYGSLNVLDQINNENPFLIHQAFEKVLQGHQSFLTDPEARILARVIASLHKNLSPENLAILDKIKDKIALTKDEVSVFKDYYKLHYKRTSQGKALLAKIKPKGTSVEVTPSPVPSSVSGDSGIPVAPPLKSPPTPPKLPPPTSAGSKAPLKPAVGKPESVSAGSGDLMSKITAGAGGLKKRTQKEIEEDNQRRAAKLLEQQKAKDAASGKTSAETSEAVQDSLFSSLKAQLAKVAKATHGSDDDDEDDYDSDWD